MKWEGQPLTSQMPPTRTLGHQTFVHSSDSFMFIVHEGVSLCNKIFNLSTKKKIQLLTPFTWEHKHEASRKVTLSSIMKKFFNNYYYMFEKREYAKLYEHLTIPLYTPCSTYSRLLYEGIPWGRPKLLARGFKPKISCKSWDPKNH